MDYAAGRATGGALTFDRDGELASQGRVSEALVAELMAHPYFALPLPKTTGREQFGVAFAAQAWARGEALGLGPTDIVASLTAFTAASVVDAYRRYLPAWPGEVILGGGGAANPTLVAMLKARLASQQTSQGRTPGAPAIKVLLTDDLGLSSDMKEAIAFAVIAYEAIHGRPGALPSCTGAHRGAVLGKITPGRNFGRLLVPPGSGS
jgi:anhydro-N-acetylmuramic acid kinase